MMTTMLSAFLLLAAAFQDPAAPKQDEPAKQDAPPAQDEAALWKVVEEGAADKVKEAFGGDAAKLLELLRKGRPVPDGAPGETKRRLKDAYGAETDLWTIVPKKYDKAKPAGLILVLHGLGANGTQLKDAFRKFAEENNYIIAAPTAQAETKDPRNEDYIDRLRGQELKHWWSYREGGFALSTLADLRKLYAIDDNRVVLCGYSMGGFAAWNVGLRFSDRFCALVPLAAGFTRSEYPAFRVDEKFRKLTLNAFNLSVYMVHGAEDAVVPVALARESRNRLQTLKYDHVYVEIPKEDHELYLKETGPVFAGVQKWLKDKVRKPHPAEVRHYALAEHCAQSYWVRVAEFKDPSAEVRATAKDNAIEFTATGAKSVTFYLDDAFFSLDKPVKVTSKGAVVFEGKIEPSLETVLETWKAREDRDLLYRAKVTVEIK